MNLIRFSVIALLIGAAPAAAQAPVAVAAFDSLELRGGGRVILRHGAQQRVTLRSGNAETSRFAVDGEGRLVIEACIRTCRNYRLEVEIVTPEIEAVAIRGGGSILAEGAFPDRNELALAVTGGGAIDLTAIESGSVAAAVRGGGSIRTRARDSLAASINGGGSVRYLGDPAVTSAIDGGGTVAPAS